MRYNFTLLKSVLLIAMCIPVNTENLEVPVMLMVPSFSLSKVMFYIHENKVIDCIIHNINVINKYIYSQKYVRLQCNNR